MSYKNIAKFIVFSLIIFFGLFLFTNLCNAQYLNSYPYSGSYGSYGGYPYSGYSSYSSYPPSYGSYTPYGSYPYSGYSSYGSSPSPYGSYSPYSSGYSSYGGYPSSSYGYGTSSYGGYPSSYGYGSSGGLTGFGGINPYMLLLYASARANPFGIQNIFYTIDTGTDLNYQIPFMQIAPLLGITSLYNSLFPELFTLE